jgi:hypothetical protein
LAATRDRAGGRDGQRKREPGTGRDDVADGLRLAGHPGRAEAPDEQFPGVDGAEQVERKRPGAFGGDRAASWSRLVMMVRHRGEPGSSGRLYRALAHPLTRAGRIQFSKGLAKLRRDPLPAPE